MIKIKLTLSVLIIIFSFNTLSAQYFNKLSFDLSSGLGNNQWNFDSSNPLLFNDNVIGFNSIQIHLENDISDYFFIKLSTGYIRKLYPLLIKDENFPEVISQRNSNLITNSLNFNLSPKFYPFKQKGNLYFTATVRFEYLLSHKDVFFILLDGSRLNYYESTINEFNKLTIWSGIGIGVDLGSKVYLQFNANTLLTNQTKSNNLDINTSTFGLSLGFNIFSFNKEEINIEE